MKGKGGERFLERAPPGCAHSPQPTRLTLPTDKTVPAKGGDITRAKLIEALNEDLSREYQAIIAYVTYSQVLKGPEYMHIAKELETHASEELAHALTISKQIDYLGGTPTVAAKPVKQSDDAEVMLRGDFENERVTIREYRRRVLQCESLGEFAISEHIREILRQEQDHLIELATALGEDVPDPGMA
jgi:bacterioferritin